MFEMLIIESSNTASILPSNKLIFVVDSDRWVRQSHAIAAAGIADQGVRIYGVTDVAKVDRRVVSEIIRVYRNKPVDPQISTLIKGLGK